MREQRPDSNRSNDRNEATDRQEKVWDQNDFASSKVSFQVTKKKKSYFRAGDYGKKRVHFFSNNKEKDKNFYELYMINPQQGSTHSNKLTCFIQENERIIYTGRRDK